MNITCKNEDGLGIISLAGAMTEGSVALFHEQFQEWFSKTLPIKYLIVDLAEVNIMDSSGLGALIGIMKELADKDVQMKIAALQKKTRLVFEITRAYKIFDIYDTQEEARADCQ